MGLMGLLTLLFMFAVECFNLLAWPLFALGYPLYASIQAIETNSISDTRKLITYWVCFSLILLFEHAFEKLLEWLPYWPYIKLLIISCLVTPHFDGSFYVYKHLVHPFLSTSPCIVFNWLTKLLVLLEQDELLIKAESEAKDIEPEAMENLIAFKPKFEQPKVVQKDINALEITEKKEVSATKQVTQMQSDFALSENITCAPVEIKEMTEALVVGGSDLPDIPPSVKMQKEWTCAVCQVRTSEESLNSHLQGKRHEDACEKLKAKNQLSKSKIASVETGRPRNKETGIYLPDKENSDNVIKPTVVCQEPVRSEADRISHLQGRQNENVNDKKKANNQTSHNETPDSVDTGPALENKETGTQHMNNAKMWLVCSVCHEIRSDMPDYASDLPGKRHTEASEKLKAKDQPQKSDISSPSAETGACPDSGIDKPHYEISNSVDVGPALEKMETGTQHMNNAKRWLVCSVCYEICSDMPDYASHLPGKRHTEASEKLKAKDQPQKSDISSPSAETGACPDSGIDKPHYKSTAKPWTCVVCKVTTTSKTDLISHFCGQRHAEALEKLKAKPSSNSSYEPWTCGICELKLNYMNDIIKHLEGKRHRNACNELKLPKKTSKSYASSNVGREVNVEVRDYKWWWKKT